MLNIKAGDKIVYTSAAGRRPATVRSITIGATAKPDHSIAWLNITVPADIKMGRRFDSSFSIPADADSLKMFQVELA